MAATPSPSTAPEPPSPGDAGPGPELVRFRAFSGLTFAFAWIPVMYTHFTRTRGFSPDEYLRLWSAYYLSMVVFELPWGWVADRIGRKPLLVLGPLWLAACFVGLGRAETLGTCTLLMAAIGCGHAIISGADSAWLYEWISAAGRRGAALREESVAHRWRLFGVSLLDVLGGLVAFGWGTMAAFDLSALVMAGAALRALGLPALRPATRLAIPGRAFAGLLGSLRAPGVGWVLLWYTSVFVLLRIGFQLYQPTLLAVGAEDLRLHGCVLGGLNVVAGLAVVFVPRAYDRHGERGAATLTLGLLAASFLGLAFASGLAVPLLFALQQVSFAFLQPLGRTALNHRIPEADRAATLSFQSLLARLVFALVLGAGAWDHALDGALGGTYLLLAAVAGACLLASRLAHPGSAPRSQPGSAPGSA